MKEKEENIGYLLNKITQQMKSHLARQLQDVNLTVAQWGVIRDLHVQEHLDEGHRRTTPAEIAERLHMDRPTMSGIVERLKGKGLLQSTPNPHDRRSFRVSLTDQAKSLYREIEPFSERTLELALTGVDPEAVEALRQTVSTMICNFVNK